MVWTATLSSKGQLVLPKIVRQKLGAHPGSKIILAERDGRFEIRSFQGDILSWYGAGADQVDGPQDWDAIREQGRLERARKVLADFEDDAS